MVLMKCRTSQCILRHFTSLGSTFLTLSEFCCRLSLAVKAPNQSSVDDQRFCHVSLMIANFCLRQPTIAHCKDAFTGILD